MSTDWNTRTKLVHEGVRRSQYGEMAEAIFMTQGFVYPSAEAAEQRFIEIGEDEFIYARYGNPTTRMFEERIAALEGTEDAFATASGMAAVNGALTSLLRAGDQRRYAQGEVGRVKLGDATAVEVQQAGSTVDLAPFQRANVARFTVSSEGSLAPVGD